jgi:hypothetical protein
MRFDVKFDLTGSFTKTLVLLGKGSVHLLETGLVLEGARPRFYVPLFISDYHRILTGWTTLTLPYPLIREYEGPAILRRSHRIEFWYPPSGAGTSKIRFQLASRSSEFESRLIEYLQLARPAREARTG